MLRSCWLGIVVVGLIGCGTSEEALKESAASPKPATKAEGIPVAPESAWTWGYFFTGTDKAAVSKRFAERKHAVNTYRVDKVVPVTGEPGIKLAAGDSFLRAESAVRLPAVEGDKAASPFMFGVPQHLEYTTKPQRDDLNKRSRAELPAGKETITVVIPIRKSAAWWALPTDERNAYFQKMADKKGHTAIGADYVDRIYRKLYHTRYAVETRDHDFITYFEFDRKHEADFKSLLKALRDPEQNPEWKYVDREYEIWLTKVE